MSNRSKAVSALGWVARIYGTFFLVFVLVFVLASVFGEEGFGAIGEEWLGFLMYPFAFLVGLAVALKWPGIGGLMVTLVMLGLIAELPSVRATDPMTLAQLGAGLLYLVYWFFSKATAKSSE